MWIPHGRPDGRLRAHAGGARRMAPVQGSTAAAFSLRATMAPGSGGPVFPMRRAPRGRLGRSGGRRLGARSRPRADDPVWRLAGRRNGPGPRTCAPRGNARRPIEKFGKFRNVRRKVCGDRGKSPERKPPRLLQVQQPQGFSLYAPGWTRTSDLRLRRPLLYPAELLAPVLFLLSRGARIRTEDLLLPKQARYRAAPHPDWSRKT
jgi:hypothetical protein